MDMREAIGIGETTEIALENACRELGLGTGEVEFEVLEFGEKKKLGLFGGKPAKVRAFVNDSPAQAAASYLKKILDGLGAEQIEIEITEGENSAVLKLTGEDAGIIIGHHGETLDALQYLVGLVANHVRDDYFRITLDTGNYREKRERTLQSLARRLAQKALATNRKFSLEPMNPYERRIIHTTVQELEGVTSWSEGVDLDRHVVIGPAGGASARSAREGTRRAPDGRDRGKARRPHPEKKPERFEHAVKPAAPKPFTPVRSVVQASEMDEVLFSAAERGATISVESAPDDAPLAAETKTENVPVQEKPSEQVLSGPAEQEADVEKVPLYGRIDIKK